MNLDLIWLGDQPAPSEWLTGQVYPAGRSVATVCSAVQRCLSQPNPDALLFWDGDLGTPPGFERLDEIMRQPVDLWHAGLQMGMAGQPGLLDFVSPTWMFNRDPDQRITATSWRLSLSACLVRAEVLLQLGFLNPGFETLDAAGLEWGHRCIRHGVLCRYLPDLLPEPIEKAPCLQLSAADELRMVYNWFGKRWTAWAVGRAVLSGYFSAPQAFQAVQALRGKTRPVESPPFQRLVGAIPLKLPSPKVSVLIPTLERYPYLDTLLKQLRQQSLPAVEIIIVDQTPVLQRQPEIYSKFLDLPLKIIYRDQPGQCSARNAGLLAATGDYILFIDDDDEIPGDLIEKHLMSLAFFKADASCGVALEPGAGSLPIAFTYLRASDVFPTNNSLLKRTALEKSGLFDLAYDRGARADADLGMRLYLTGARIILNPAIAVLHHHSPRGGLRTHHARKITYASSRQRLWHRQILSPTELYLAMRYYNHRQVTELKWINLFATLSLHGSRFKRVVKFLLGCLLLPQSGLRLLRNQRKAEKYLQTHPTIPTLPTLQE